MKICLINSDYMLYGHPPLGLASLATYLKKENPSVQIKIYDQINEKQIMKNLKKDKPDIIGLSAVSENWFNVKILGKKIKKKIKNSKLIIGGIHVTTQPSCFEKSVFDYGILGEGEIPFTKLVKIISDKKEETDELRKIKGLIFRENNSIINTGIAEQIQDLSEIPLPDLELLNMDYYSLPSFSGEFKRSTLILTSRGCPYNCKFCSSSRFWDRKIRFFSAKRVADEIEIAYRKYGFNNISMSDDLFSINEDRLKKLISELKERGLLGKIKFTCGGRANLFTESMARLLKELGIIKIAFGFESGSDKVLKWLKGESVNVEINRKAIELCEKHKITAFGFFILGSPYETLEDMEKTYEFIKKYCKENFIIYQTVAYPGTEIWKYALENKIINGNIYEKETKEFVETDFEHLLTKEVSKEEFGKMYKKINGLRIKKNRGILFKNIKNTNLEDIRAYSSKIFMKKVWNLRGRLLTRIK